MFEKTIISNLIHNEDYVRKVLPNLKPEYFDSHRPEAVAFDIIDTYVKKYNNLPALEAIGIELNNRKNLDQKLFEDTADFLGSAVSDYEPVNIDWLVDQTENFAKDKAIHLALTKALEIVTTGGEKGLSKGAIPKIFEDALSVSFDPHIGHNYIDDAERRFDGYNVKLKKVPFDLDYMNKITQGGLNPKTLNVVMAVSGAGKSLFMAHCAAAQYMMGKNVLYISLELAEEMVGQRIDANLMGIDMASFRYLEKAKFLQKIKDIKSKTGGELVFKEYAPGSAGLAHFRYLLNELRMKKGFTPDIIYIDYLNICACTSRKGEMNSYERIKLIAEELRSLGVEYGIPIFTATQTNRSGYGSSDVDMESVSESLGLPMTADLLFGLIQTDELKQLGQYKVKQLKSRYDDIGRCPSFILGVDKTTMRIYDVGESAQTLNNSAPTQQPKNGFGGGLNFKGFQ